MNTMLIAVILGWLIIESRAVRIGIRTAGSPDRFSLGYYLRNNWAGLMFNAISTSLVYLMSDAVMLAEQHFVVKWTADPALAERMTTAVMAPVTGGFIGLCGAALVRWSLGKADQFFAPKDDEPGTDA